MLIFEDSILKTVLNAAHEQEGRNLSDLFLGKYIEKIGNHISSSIIIPNCCSFLRIFYSNLHCRNLSKLNFGSQNILSLNHRACSNLYTFNKSFWIEMWSILLFLTLRAFKVNHIAQFWGLFINFIIIFINFIIKSSI